MFQARPQPRPPPPPPRYQEFPANYHQAPPATDYSPSAPVLPTDYFPQQGIPTGGAGNEYPMQPLPQGYPQQIPGYFPQQDIPTGGAGSEYPMQPLPQGYPQQIPGYPQPPYVRAEQEAPSQPTATQHPAAPTPESVRAYMTRRQRTRRQS